MTVQSYQLKRTAGRWSLLCLLTVFLFGSCSEEELRKESVITVDQNSYTEFDYWLQRNYVAAYNIRFKYRFEDIESDMNYYTVPSKYEDAVKLAHLVKYMCLEAYDEVGGIDFTRAYFPKLIFTIGEWEYRNNGTYILGQAEGGRKILLSGTNYLNRYLKNAEELNEYYLKTIHHEFTHIMNQTKDYSADFQLITGTSYVADKWSEVPFDQGYLQRGFISAYAQHSDKEDFAEMLSMFVCNSEQRWERWMNEAGADGARLITAKLDIVKSYMQNAFNIDLEQLRSSLQRRQKEVVEGRISLTDLSL
ncbi:MAG: putative zinc-binding metallopeptidase [Prevotella sp.]|nr:putative zinc-binding metallopeptidase [Prevotella sp.]MBR6964340.1 putative zinc-binding metallopeptidase [Prevotella sp.]